MDLCMDFYVYGLRKFKANHLRWRKLFRIRSGLLLESVLFSALIGLGCILS